MSEPPVASKMERGWGFPIVAPLEYTAFRRHRLIRKGSGETIRIASTKVLFNADLPLDPDLWLQVSILWPASMEGSPQVRLEARAEIFLAHGTQTVVRLIGPRLQKKPNGIA